MGYSLGWIESLTACLLIFALVMACSARLARRWLYIILPTLAALLWLLAGRALVVWGVVLMWKAPLRTFIFYMSSWTVAFAVGAVIVLRRGLGVRADVPPAKSWPRTKLAIATGVAILAYAMTLWNVNLAAQNKLAAIRAEAGALALSILPSRPPDSENAALLYEKASELIGKDTKTPRYSDDADAEKLQAFLREHEPALRLLRRAAVMPHCYFDRGYPIPTSWEELMRGLDDLRQGARLLELDARVQAAQGQAGPALEDVSAIFGMARHMGESPFLIHVLVTINIGSIGHSTLEAVLADCEPSEADLAVLRPDEVFSYWRLFQRSIRMERAYGLSVFADQHAAGVGAAFTLKELSGYRSLMAELDKVLALPCHEALQGMKRLEAEALGGRRGLFAAGLYPALETNAANAAMAEAMHRLDNLALAATAYRIKHGAFPTQPDDLVPEFLMAVPKDPFDGEPIRMKATEEGILFHSIGPDTKDDGGAELKYNGDTGNWIGDPTFRLRMSAAKSPRNGAR